MQARLKSPLRKASSPDCLWLAALEADIMDVPLKLTVETYRKCTVVSNFQSAAPDRHNSSLRACMVRFVVGGCPAPRAVLCRKAAPAARLTRCAACALRSAPDSRQKSDELLSFELNIMYLAARQPLVVKHDAGVTVWVSRGERARYVHGHAWRHTA